MIKRMALLAALLLSVCVSGYRTGAQQQSPTAGNKRSTIIYDGDLAALLAQLTQIYKANIGFETIPFQPRPRIKIDTSFATLGDLLNAIVAADPSYQWRTSDGFIDVYPQQ